VGYQGNMGHKQDFDVPVSGFLSVYDLLLWCTCIRFSFCIWFIFLL